MMSGISTLMFRDQPLNRDMLRNIRETGIESVELTDYHPGFVYDDPMMFDALREDILAAGLHLNSWHIHLEQFDRAYDLAALDSAQREKSIKAYKLAVDGMERLGGGILVTHDIRVPEPGEDAHDHKRVAFVENMGIVAAYAEPRGVRMALENTGSGYTRDPERLVALMDDIRATNVGICIDTGHRNLCGDPVDALRIAGSHLITLHIQDNHGEQDEHLLPDLGQIDWTGVSQALKDIDYQGVFMYELIRPEDLAAVYPNFRSIL